MTLNPTESLINRMSHPVNINSPSRKQYLWYDELGKYVK